jgi:AcrR family transcriptional regulator
MTSAASKDGDTPQPSWQQRVAEDSPVVQASRKRSIERAEQIVQAAIRLIERKGPEFTTQELVKEARVAIQTFYKYFASKDQVLLAVIETLISENTARFSKQAEAIANPVERLRFLVTAALNALGSRDGAPRFITSEHWRLHQLYPEQLAQATRGFTDAILPPIREAAEAGLLSPRNPEYDAWLTSRLITSVYHNYDYAELDAPTEEIIERVWQFCLAALGGAPS